MFKSLVQINLLILTFSTYGFQVFAQSIDTLSSEEVKEMEAITRSFMASKTPEELSMFSCENITARVKGELDSNAYQVFNKNQFSQLMKVYNIPLIPISSVDSAEIKYDHEYQAVKFSIFTNKDKHSDHLLTVIGNVVFLKFKKSFGKWYVSSIFFLWNYAKDDCNYAYYNFLVK